MEFIIQARNITKSYAAKAIIKGIDFSLEAGAFVAIMGPSGAGKTTFMNMLSGLESGQGDVIINNENISTLKEPKLTKFRRRHISYVFQEYNLVDFLDVRDNIVLPLKIAGSKLDDALYEEVLALSGLKEHERKLPGQLSGGQKQRVAIVRSIVSGCDIIFADEPTGALDIRTRNQIMDIFTNLVKKYRRTLVLVTHDPHVAAYADRVVFVFDGKVYKEIPKATAHDIGAILEDLESGNA